MILSLFNISYTIWNRLNWTRNSLYNLRPSISPTNKTRLLSKFNWQHPLCCSGLVDLIPTKCLYVCVVYFHLQLFVWSINFNFIDQTLVAWCREKPFRKELEIVALVCRKMKGFRQSIFVIVRHTNIHNNSIGSHTHTNTIDNKNTPTTMGFWGNRSSITYTKNTHRRHFLRLNQNFSHLFFFYCRLKLSCQFP